MISEEWVHSRLASPLVAALAQMVELSVPAIDADAGAGRVYAPAASSASYVSTGRLGMPRQDEPAVHDWPMEPQSVFEQLRGRGASTGAFRPHMLIAPDRPAEALFGPIEARSPVTDALALPVALDAGPWALVMFFRCGDNPPFKGQHVRQLDRLADSLAAALRRAQAQQQGPIPSRSTPPPATADRWPHARPGVASPPAPGTPRSVTGPGRVTTTTPPTDGHDVENVVEAVPDVAALLERLSVTERRVLRYLCSGYTERQIGEALDRSPHTIHVHVKNIYRKLTIRSRKELLQLFEGYIERAGSHEAADAPEAAPVGDE